MAQSNNASRRWRGGLEAASSTTAASRVCVDGGVLMKILMIDDHALFRAGLRLLLTAITSDAEVLEAASLDEAQRLQAHQPGISICLLDLMLDGHVGAGSLVRLRSFISPGVAVVVLSGDHDPDLVRACLDAGAMSFVPKHLSASGLGDALRQVLAGRVYLPAELVHADGHQGPIPVLAPRQLEVLHALSRGLTPELIARELGVPEQAVKEHLDSVFQALGVHNRTDAMVRAARLGLSWGPR